VSKTDWLILAAPLSVASYPVAQFGAGNPAGEVLINEILMLLLISVSGAAILLGLIFSVLRNRSRAVAMSVLVVAAFFSYGHILNIIRGMVIDLPLIDPFRVGREMIFLPLFVVICLGTAEWLRRTKHDLRSVLLVIGVASIILTTLNLTLIGVGWQLIQSNSVKPLHSVDNVVKPLPDVYIFLFDAYSRGDVLSDLHGFDNSPFLDQLESLGFFIADNSKTNYISTQTSIQSTFNMDYSEGRTGSDFPSQVWRGPYVAYNIEATTLGATATELGYVLHSFASGERKGLTFGGLTHEFVRTTFLTAVVDSASTVGFDRLGVFNINTVGGWEGEKFEQNMEDMSKLSSDPRSTLSFSYSWAPHGPPGFNRDGSRRIPIWGDIDTQVTGYLDEIGYINKVMLSTVDDILSSSAIQPIIIIMSDHGSIYELSPWNDVLSETYWIEQQSTPVTEFERTGILNAVLVPENCRSSLYSSMTPVNTFRIIFNNCFGTSFETLDDTTYWGDRKLFMLD